MSEACCREYLTPEGDVGLCGRPFGHTGKCGLLRVASPAEVRRERERREEFLDSQAEREKSPRETTSSGAMCWR